MIDLHTHSSASDGTFSPSELVRFAKTKNITTLALTDHDTTDGLLEAQAAAKEEGIIFVPGIEISIQWPTGEFHLLGLGLTHTSPELAEIITFLREERNQRNRKIVERLKEQGIDVSYEEIIERAGTRTIGRPHFAEFLVSKGIVKDRQKAFDQFFAKGRPCYVDKTAADLETAVKAIKTSGGIPVQAHPLSMYVSWGKMEDTVINIQSMGVEGLEAYHPGIRLSEAQRLEEMAHKLGMIATGGSDFHGEKVRTDRHIGYSTGGYKVKERFWEEELMPALAKAHKDGKHLFSEQQ